MFREAFHKDPHCWNSPELWLFFFYTERLFTCLHCLSLMQLRVSDCLICRTAHYYFDATLNLNSDCFGFLTRTNLNKQLQQIITNNYNKQLQTITSIKYIIYFVMNPISINSDQLQLPFCAPSSLDQKEQSSHESGYSI